LEHFKASNEKNWGKIDFIWTNLVVFDGFLVIFGVDTVADCVICLERFAEGDGGQVGENLS
jgi:hypothetical protein